MKREEQAIHELVGAIKAFKVTGNFMDAARYSLYRQLKDTKAYSLLNKDWKDFCAEDLGRDQKTVNMEIKLLEEYGESFLMAAEKIHLTKRDLLALGSGLSEDAKVNLKKGVIRIGDVEIKEAEIEERVDELRDAIESLAKTHEEAKAQAKAQQRLADDFRKNNEKLHQSLERLERREERLDKNPNALEEEFIVQLQGFRVVFDRALERVDPETEAVREIFREEDKDGKEKKHKPTMKMRACYLETLGYMKKMTTAFYGMAEELVGTAEMFPENVWRPGEGAEIVDAMRNRAGKER